MAKTMARIENDVVVNLEWVNDDVQVTDELKDIYDLQVEVGDVYNEGTFYRNGIEVLTYRQQVQNALSNYDNALTEIEETVSTPTLLTTGDETPLTIEERKQNVLDRVDDILNALYALEVVPSE